MRISNRSEIPNNYGLAIAANAAEFIEEDLDEWKEKVPELKLGGAILYFFDDTKSEYKHEVWISNENIEKLNKKPELEKFDKLFIEIEMALGFLRAFLEEENFSDLYEDVCDTYSALVDAQMTQAILQTVYENIQRKF